jgi:hypothetical protein
MANENPVYLKLEYWESLEGKKDILNSEMSLLNLLKIIKKYSAIRTEELEIKSRVYRRMKELVLAMKKVKSSFPFVKVPEKGKKEEFEEEVYVTKKGEDFDEDLKSQLQEIQKRLDSLNK